jgi:RNA polymerase sigma-70 factor, ECF subfamily
MLPSMRVTVAMRTTNLDDLARMAPGGDQAVVGELLEACRPVLLEHVRRYELPAGGGYSAEDVVQDAFTAVAIRLADKSFADFIHFRAWVREFVVHAFRDRLKYQLRERRDVRRGAPAGGGADPLGAVADGGTGPDRAARRPERAELLLKAIDSLADRYRRVIEIRYLQGFTVKEAARLLELEPTTVRTMSCEAKKMLREALGSSDDILSSGR